MDEDEVLSKITRLLEKGCTMLATHHDCGAPLFRCQGEVVCPVCSFAGEPYSPTGAQPSGISGTEQSKNSIVDNSNMQKNGDIGNMPSDNAAKPELNDDKDDMELMAAIGFLRASLLHRLREFTAAMEDEHDLDRLKKQLDCLEGLLRVLRSLR